MSAHPGLILLAIVCFVGFCALVAVWSRRDLWGRHLAAALFVLGTPAAVLGMVDAQGWAKPLWAAYELNGKYRVIGTKMVIGQGIYVWLDLPRSLEPRAFSMPWDPQMASKMQEMIDRDGDAKMLMEFKYEWSWDRNAPQFHPLPPPPIMPPKERREEAPRIEQEA